MADSKRSTSELPPANILTHCIYQAVGLLLFQEIAFYLCIAQSCADFSDGLPNHEGPTSNRRV